MKKSIIASVVALLLLSIVPLTGGNFSHLVPYLFALLMTGIFFLALGNESPQETTLTMIKYGVGMFAGSFFIASIPLCTEEVVRVYPDGKIMQTPGIPWMPAVAFAKPQQSMETSLQIACIKDGSTNTVIVRTKAVIKLNPCLIQEALTAFPNGINQAELNSLLLDLVREQVANADLGGDETISANNTNTNGHQIPPYDISLTKLTVTDPSQP